MKHVINNFILPQDASIFMKYYDAHTHLCYDNRKPHSHRNLHYHTIPSKKIKNLFDEAFKDGVSAGLFKNFHPIIATVLAAGAGAYVSGVIDRNLNAFALGGDFITSGPQMMLVGDNPGGRERVQVTPLSSPNLEGPQSSGVTVQFNGPITNDDYVRDFIVPDPNEEPWTGGPGRRPPVPRTDPVIHRSLGGPGDN